MNFENEIKNEYKILELIGNIADELNVEVRAIGGFVRDLILEKKNEDIDIVCLCDCETFVKHIAKKLNIKEVAIYKNYGTAMIKYENFQIELSIARGLDYYTRTVFEFVSKIDGLTVLGGGRYDGLAEELGGAKTPAVGFATGMERLIGVFLDNNPDLNLEKNMQIFVAYIGDKANLYATKYVEKLRENEIYAEKDIMGRSLKAQLKYADKKQAKFVITIGDNEIETGKAPLKNMETGESEETDLTDMQVIINKIM